MNGLLNRYTVGFYLFRLCCFVFLWTIIIIINMIFIAKKMKNKISYSLSFNPTIHFIFVIHWLCVGVGVCLCFWVSSSLSQMK